MKRTTRSGPAGALLGGELPSDVEWTAITGCDASADGAFWYAVRSTGIFCRPSCRSRDPRRDRALVFRTPEQAMAAGFRSCKRCEPEKAAKPDEAWLAEMEGLIAERLRAGLSLGELADAACLSPWHLHRRFKRATGLTPQQYIRRERIARAKRLLDDTELTAAAVAKECGIPSASRFIALFRQEAGCTPAEYRRRTGGDQDVEGGKAE